MPTACVVDCACSKSAYHPPPPPPGLLGSWHPTTVSSKAYTGFYPYDKIIPCSQRIMLNSRRTAPLEQNMLSCIGCRGVPYPRHLHGMKVAPRSRNSPQRRKSHLHLLVWERFPTMRENVVYDYVEEQSKPSPSKATKGLMAPAQHADDGARVPFIWNTLLWASCCLTRPADVDCDVSSALSGWRSSRPPYRFCTGLFEARLGHALH